MVTLIHRIIRALVAPRATISCPPQLWEKLISLLNERSGGIRESGAFLLGTIQTNGHRVVQNFVLYDDIDPDALDTGAVHVRSEAFSTLWDICNKESLSVVADVHTHPGQSVAQSSVDKNNPMIVLKGHVSIILPHYGHTPKDSSTAGIYEYLGAKQWRTLQSPKNVQQAIYVGRWWR